MRLICKICEKMLRYCCKMRFTSVVVFFRRVKKGFKKFLIIYITLQNNCECMSQRKIQSLSKYKKIFIDRTEKMHLSTGRDNGLNLDKIHKRISNGLRATTKT
ncbi:hypothetical protein EDEG_01223 [Edhazardia aedis USNM 41457]|uniref:Uncharacterized protein n=1 Tax=Edhazardia aedis (strain USNM 41457) TaxID=1003232 RepID=J9DAS3_EDHAE|nr:hypothetical protein EDEG_01223 [Edhazardia aedis USNM 41457]|eukprot:EJW04574.1 hypothetical protein EDEG_01223 [Edhazardia aedis USNM 41457]